MTDSKDNEIRSEAFAKCACEGWARRLGHLWSPVHGPANDSILDNTSRQCNEVRHLDMGHYPGIWWQEMLPPLMQMGATWHIGECEVR